MEKGYPPIWYEWGFSEEERFEHYRQICKRVGYGCIPTPSVEAAKEIITEVFGDGEGVVAYDIGAAVGSWSKKHTGPLQHFPKIRSILFEANPELEFLYQEKDWEYHIGFLGESDGDVLPFHCHFQHIGGNSRYLENTEAFQEKSFALMLPLEKLDTVVDKKSLPLPDIIKMDVQGSEKDIMMGAANCLAHAKILIVEAQHSNYNEGAPKVEEVLEYAYSQGFTLWRGEVSKTPYDADYFLIKRD